MVRDWDLFSTTKDREILERKKHGVVVAYWNDDCDWRWDVAGLEYFKMPRPTQIGVGNLPYCGIRADITPEKLYDKIRNPEIAKEAGWDVEEVKQTLMRAAPADPNSDDWEAWERYWKDNDYMMSYDKAVCQLVLLPVLELDQTITLLLFNYDGTGKFLYTKRGAFGGMERFCQIYTENVGTNKYYHSIRGFGHRIYSEIQTYNRMLNQFADSVYVGGMLAFSPPNESDADAEAYSQSGPWLVMNEGWQQAKLEMPNLQQSVIPGLSVFTDRIQKKGSRIGSGNTGLYGDGKTPKHMFEAQLEQMAMNTDANLESYLSTWERHWRQIVRRATREGYLPKEPGGVAVAEFRKRCLERGVSGEAINNVDWKRCKINRGVGAGSAAARILAYDRLEAMKGDMSTESQQLFARDKSIAIGGIQSADRYFPKPQNRRISPDVSYADATNPELMRGEQIPVRDGQNHVAIAEVRMQKLEELNQMVQQGGQPALDQVVVPMHYLLDNMQQHLEKANPLDPKVKELEDNAGQFNQMVTNGLRRLKAKQAKMMAEMAHNAGKVGDQQVEAPQGSPQGQNGNAPQGSNGVNLDKAMEKSLELKFKIEMNQLKIANERAKGQAAQAKAAQEMQLADLTAAANIRRSRLQ